MNKSIALLIIGVISLAMVLIMLNQGTTTTAQPPLVGVQNPLPQTGVPTSSALQVPTSLPSTPAAVQQKSPASTQAAAAKTQSAPTTPPVAQASPAQPSASATTQTVSPLAPPVQDLAQPTRENAERQTQATPAPSTSAVKEKPAAPAEKKPTPPPAPPAPPKAAGPKTISKIIVSAAGDGATVRIAGTTTLTYKTMHLKSPDRVVVDMDGVWAVKAPGVPANKAVTNVRIGKQPDKTRIVIDLSSPAAMVNFVKINDETLDVRIK